MRVDLEIVPTQGSPTNTQIELEPTGASVAEVLRKANIDGERKDIVINGKPATLDTHVQPNSKLSVKISVSERPRGS